MSGGSEDLPTNMLQRIRYSRIRSSALSHKSSMLMQRPSFVKYGSGVLQANPSLMATGSISGFMQAPSMGKVGSGLVSANASGVHRVPAGAGESAYGDSTKLLRSGRVSNEGWPAGDQLGSSSQVLCLPKSLHLLAAASSSQVPSASLPLVQEEAAEGSHHARGPPDLHGREGVEGVARVAGAPQHHKVAHVKGHVAEAQTGHTGFHHLHHHLHHHHDQQQQHQPHHHPHHHPHLHHDKQQQQEEKEKQDELSLELELQRICEMGQSRQGYSPVVGGATLEPSGSMLNLEEALRQEHGADAGMGHHDHHDDGTSCTTEGSMALSHAAGEGPSHAAEAEARGGPQRKMRVAMQGITIEVEATSEDGKRSGFSSYAQQPAFNLHMESLQESDIAPELVPEASVSLLKHGQGSGTRLAALKQPKQAVLDAAREALERASALNLNVKVGAAPDVMLTCSLHAAKDMAWAWLAYGCGLQRFGHGSLRIGLEQFSTLCDTLALCARRLSLKRPKQ